MGLHEFDNGECVTCADAEPLDEESAALLAALNELDGPLGDALRAAWDPAKHVRNPKGPGGGRFRSNVDKLKDAIVAHKAGSGEGHPFDGYNREQLRRVAKARGIELGRGEDRDSIAKKLLDHLDEKTSQSKPAAHGKAKVLAEAIHAAPYLRESGGPPRNGVDTKNVDSALNYYKGAGYLGINEDLRKGIKNGREQEDIDAIDAGMGPLAHDVEVYRGIRDPAKVFGGAWNDHDVTGLEWRDDAYVSTSGDGRSSNAAFSGANGAVMRIVASKGTKAVGVTDYAEMELLLDRGLKYRVVKDNGVVDGRRRLDVEVIP